MRYNSPPHSGSTNFDFTSFFADEFTAERAQAIYTQFEAKLEFARTALGLPPGFQAVALQVWNYFTDPSVTDTTKILAGVGLLYFVVPSDLIFDSVPLLGLADDLAMLSMVVRQIARAAEAGQSARRDFGMDGDAK